MAKIKFQSNILEVSEDTSLDLYVDSEATHYIFYNCHFFEDYSTFNEERIKRATGMTKILGKGVVKLPIKKWIDCRSSPFSIFRLIFSLFFSSLMNLKLYF